MPSLSINSKDLDSLGINLKDLLKAIAQTKSSGDDVIKIKKRKKKVKKVKTKGNKLSGLSKVSTINPFPPAQKMSNLPPQVSGGGASFQPPPFQTKIEVKNEPQKQDSINQQQLVSFQNETKQQLKDIQEAQAYNTHGLHATGLALTRMLKNNNRYNMFNQSLPPPTNLGNLYSGTYYREYEVDTTDGEGVVSKNEPMQNIRVQDISFEDNPMIQQTELGPQQEDQPIEEDQPTDYTTDIQDTVGFEDVQSEQDQTKTAGDELVPQTPEVKFADVYQDVPDVAQRKQYYKKIPIEQQKKRGRKPKTQEPQAEPAIFDNLIDLADERKHTPRKQPLAEIPRMTRRNSDHSKLVNPETGISPFGESKKKSKQQKLNEFYGKRNAEEEED
ncbi:MAG: hypothetical protein ACK50E_04435 [Bacteroidota bacterium]